MKLPPVENTRPADLCESTGRVRSSLNSERTHFGRRIAPSRRPRCCAPAAIHVRDLHFLSASAGQRFGLAFCHFGASRRSAKILAFPW